MSERKITDLFRRKTLVYVYLANEKIREKFLLQAEAEGLMFKNGRKPGPMADTAVVRLKPDKTINYICGFAEHMLFRSECTEKADGQTILRIDYQKYSEGKKNYMYVREEEPRKRRISDLLYNKNRLYFYLASENEKSAFADAVTREHLMFPDGTFIEKIIPGNVMMIDKRGHVFSSDELDTAEVESEEESDQFIKVDYQKYIQGETDYLFTGNIYMRIEENKRVNIVDLPGYDRSIYEGTSCFLVKDPAPSYSQMTKLLYWLRSEGFACCKDPAPGTLRNCIYVNVNARTYMYSIGEPPICDLVGNATLTVEEFNIIYGILRKYSKE